MIARALVAFAALTLAACTTVSPLPVSPARQIEWTGLAANGIPAEHVTVWLPPGYDQAKARRYPVLYMWDGQNLFDPAITQYKKAWLADQVLTTMVAEQAAEPHIVVGIWSPSGLDRYRVYLPTPLYQALSGSPALKADIERMAGGFPAGDRMLAWTADVLKPRIDREFRTRPEPRDTTVVGASMGGLMSCYAIVARPDVFGRAGCVSSHFALVDPELAKQHASAIDTAWANYLAAHLGAPRGRRVWMDHGTKTLDAYYGPWQQALAHDFASQGWREGRDYTARVFEGAEHDEVFWHARMAEMLGWLWH